MFLEEILKNDDVWIVPIKEGIAYAKNGTVTNDQLVNNDFPPFNFVEPERDTCRPTTCKYDISNNPDFSGIQNYYLHTCTLTCPRNFPWLGNPLGM